uniref:Integrase core domain containing protein n=1 Tax=Solanum tuberosum TaxID=4113 RepID=M1DUG9_SOLTU
MIVEVMVLDESLKSMLGTVLVHDHNRRTTILHIRGPKFRDPKIDFLIYGGDQRSVIPSTVRSTSESSIGTMAPKQAPIYSRKGKSKSVAPSRRMLDEGSDHEYIPETTRGSPTALGPRGAGPDILFHPVTSGASTSSSNGLVPPRAEPSATKPNRWCVEGQYQIYSNTKMFNEHEKMARIITEECRVLTQSLHTVPTIEELFRRYMCEWITQSLGKFSEEMTREFYASYAATVHNDISKQEKPLAQPLLLATFVQKFSIDIFETTICWFIYGSAHNLLINITEYVYRMGVVQSGEF